MKICGWQSFAFPVSGMLGGGIDYKCPFNTVGNNRYFLGVCVHLIEVSA